MLDAVDKTLIPGAKNAELKALLVKVRPAFVAHLEHAKQMQASLAEVRTLTRRRFATSSFCSPAARQPVPRSRRRKPVTHTVTIDGTALQPAALTIKPGTRVVWVNKDIVSHTATSTAPKVFESGTLDTGKSWKMTFKTKGDFPYSCRFHPTMKASLKVE